MMPGDFVRLLGHRGRGHAKAAKVVKIEPGRVLVRPGGHKQDEWVDARHVRPWKAKNAKCPISPTRH